MRALSSSTHTTLLTFGSLCCASIVVLCVPFSPPITQASGGKGASLQNYNNELVKCIDDLREKREEVNRQILASEEEKAKIQKVR